MRSDGPSPRFKSRRPDRGKKPNPAYSHVGGVFFLGTGERDQWTLHFNSRTALPRLGVPCHMPTAGLMSLGPGDAASAAPNTENGQRIPEHGIRRA